MKKEETRIAKELWIWLTSSNYRKQIKAGVRLMQRFRNIKMLQRHFHRGIYQKFNCEINEMAVIHDTVDFVHPIGIVIGAGAVIGENVAIFQNVTIGAVIRNDAMPVIKNNVTIYAGAKVVGGIEIGNDVTIGANTVVTKTVPDNCTVVGMNRILPKREEGL